MLAYTADTRRAAGRAGSAKALTLIIAGHALVLAAVLTAKMDLIVTPPQGRTTLVDFKDPPKPRPQPTVEKDPQRPATQDSFIDQTRTIIDMDRQFPTIPFDDGPTIEDIGKVIGTGPTIVPDPPKHAMIAARLATAEGALKPPYPNDKLRAEEEATLKLRLTIDARGRVVAVDPVGAADSSFLEAARRHILRAWRYKPAMDDGVAVPSSTVISLSFRLEDV